MKRLFYFLFAWLFLISFSFAQVPEYKAMTATPAGMFHSPTNLDFNGQSVSNIGTMKMTNLVVQSIGLGTNPPISNWPVTGGSGTLYSVVGKGRVSVSTNTGPEAQIELDETDLVTNVDNVAVSGTTNWLEKSGRIIILHAAPGAGGSTSTLYSIAVLGRLSVSTNYGPEACIVFDIAGIATNVSNKAAAGTSNYISMNGGVVEFNPSASGGGGSTSVLYKIESGSDRILITTNFGPAVNVAFDMTGIFTNIANLAVSGTSNYLSMNGGVVELHACPSTGGSTSTLCSIVGVGRINVTSNYGTEANATFDMTDIVTNVENVAASGSSNYITSAGGVVTHHPATSSGGGVDTNVTYNFNVQENAMAWGSKIQTLNTISTNFIINPALGTYIKWRMTNDGSAVAWKLTNTFANLDATYSVPITIEITHDKTTNAYKVVYWSTNVLFPGGVQPILTQTNDAVDMFQFIWNGSKWVYINQGTDIR